MMSLRRLLLCLALLAATSAGAAETAWETTVAVDGEPVLPMHGTVAGQNSDVGRSPDRPADRDTACGSPKLRRAA